MSNPAVTTVIFATGDPDGIAADQTVAAAGNLVINGALASGGAVTMDAARRVVIVSVAGDETVNTFTIYGTDRYGNTQSESLTGPGVGLTVISKLDYLTVTRIAISAASIGHITAGTSDASTIGSGPWIPFNPQITPAQISYFVTVALTSASTWTIEVTPDDVNVMAPPGGTASSAATGVPGTPPYPGSGSIEPRSFVPPRAWAAHADLTTKSADAHKFVEDVIMYWRLTINSGITAVTAQGIQAGIRN